MPLGGPAGALSLDPKGHHGDAEAAAAQRKRADTFMKPMDGKLEDPAAERKTRNGALGFNTL